MYLFVFEEAQAMCSGQNPQWTVLCRGIIEVQTQGQHPLQGMTWRMSVKHPILARPGPPTRTFTLLFKRQSGVLMPDDQLIRRERLIEKRCAERHGALAEHVFRDANEARIGGQSRNARIF